LIGNSILALLANPDQIRLLRADPALLPGAVEELLRYEGPANTSTLRFTTEPVRVGDVTIPEHELVLVSPASANRDPAKFGEPDRLDVTRDATGHLGFGHGIHFCLGSHLARAEAEIALRKLLERFRDWELAGEPDDVTWRSSALIHGIDRLPARFS
jgi:cytochrome P450